MISSGCSPSACGLTRLAKRAAGIALAFLVCMALLPHAQYSAAAKRVKKESEKSGAAKTAAAKPAPTPIDTHGKIMVVDFAAVWCAPCKRFAPIFDKVSKDFKDKAEFQHIDVDQSTQYADYYKVNSVPTIMILDGKGNIKYNHTGIIDEKELVEQVTKATSGQ